MIGIGINLAAPPAKGKSLGGSIIGQWKVDFNGVYA